MEQGKKEKRKKEAVLSFLLLCLRRHHHRHPPFTNLAFWTAAICSASFILSSSLPRKDRALRSSFSAKTPILRQMDSAVSFASPVITITRIPARRHYDKGKGDRIRKKREGSEKEEGQGWAQRPESRSHQHGHEEGEKRWDKREDKQTRKKAMKPPYIRLSLFFKNRRNLHTHTHTHINKEAQANAIIHYRGDGLSDFCSRGSHVVARQQKSCHTCPSFLVPSFGSAFLPSSLSSFFLHPFSCSVFSPWRWPEWLPFEEDPTWQQYQQKSCHSLQRGTGLHRHSEQWSSQDKNRPRRRREHEGLKENRRR